MQLSELVGESLARRTIGGDAQSHVIDTPGPLEVAEANVLRTPLVGRSIAENRVGDFGASVLGVWERGEFSTARPDLVIKENAVLVLGGTRQQLESCDEGFAIYNVSGEPVVVVGGSRVGRATARSLTERGVAWRMVERDAANRPPGVSDERFRPRRRGGRGRVEEGRHRRRAGGDFDEPRRRLEHLSDDPAAARQHRADAEGLNIVRVTVPPALAGKSLAETTVRQDTGATIIAAVEDGAMRVNPGPADPLPRGGEVLLVGDAATEQNWAERYGAEAV